MKQIISLLIIVSSMNACTNKQTSFADMVNKGEWIDLSYEFSPGTLYWPNNASGFRLDTLSEGTTPGGYYYSSYTFTAPEHGGTHLDAPAHFSANGLTTDKIDLSQLTGEAVVIDISAKALKNADYLITADDILQWEKKNDTIAVGTILLFRTGYGQFYPDAAKYFGTIKKGVEGIAELHFPGIDPGAAQWMIQHKIKAAGIDTPSIDYGQSKDFKTHQLLMGANIPAFENMANMNKLPETGAYIVALPMKIKNGSGGPLRIIAWSEKK
jgi:kynurenine formamidase